MCRKKNGVHGEREVVLETMRPNHVKIVFKDTVVDAIIIELFFGAYGCAVPRRDVPAIFTLLFHVRAFSVNVNFLSRKNSLSL